VARGALRLEGKLIDFGRNVELPAPILIREFIEWFLDDVLDELGSRKSGIRLHISSTIERRPPDPHLRADGGT